MERLAFLPVVIATTIVASRLNLTYAGLAILVGILIPIVSSVRGQDMFNTPALGYALLLIGLAFLALAYFVCSNYGISFEALDQDRSFPKTVRRSPYFGIAFMTSGVTVIALTVFRK